MTIKKKKKDKYQTHSLGFVFITQSHGYCQNVKYSLFQHDTGSHDVKLNTCTTMP